MLILDVLGVLFFLGPPREVRPARPRFCRIERGGDLAAIMAVLPTKNLRRLPLINAVVVVTTGYDFFV